MEEWGSPPPGLSEASPWTDGLEPGILAREYPDILRELDEVAFVVACGSHTIIRTVDEPEMDRPPKKIRRLLREQLDRAYEEELRRALEPLHEAFGRWKKEELGSFELNELIHRFHQGPSRQLFSRYNGTMMEMSVAHAIVSGVLDRNDVPAELLDCLRTKIEFYEQLEDAEE